MDIFAGLTAPQINRDIQDQAVQDNIRNICRFLDEMLIKMKKSPGTSTTVTVVTDVRTNAGQLQKKTKLLTLVDGVVSSVGTESDWVNAGAV
jgi:hypothetical protein